MQVFIAIIYALNNFMKVRMSIIYPDGTAYTGKRDFSTWIDYLQFNNLDLTGKRVLDVATDEGWWAFWSEMQCAEYVEASDVEHGEDYDWGAEKDWTWINNLKKRRGGRAVFDFHHSNLHSNIVYKTQSVYDVKGEFDLVFCHGLLYHLRHPLLAIDNISKVCKGCAVIETHVDTELEQDMAYTKFYRTTELQGSISNWTGASTACYTSWMKDAGFEHVYYSTQPFWSKDTVRRRKFFVGLKTDEFKQMFDKNKNFAYCNDLYWQKVFSKSSYN
jgi:tRNA (mo5U34)-methyltransferase